MSGDGHLLGALEAQIGLPVIRSNNLSLESQATHGQTVVQSMVNLALASGFCTRREGSIRRCEGTTATSQALRHVVLICTPLRSPDMIATGLEACWLQTRRLAARQTLVM